MHCLFVSEKSGVKERMKNLIKFERQVFRIVIAAIVVCFIAAICFLTNQKKFPISLTKIQITWAYTLDMRSMEPSSYRLNDEELGELKDRLQALEIGKRNSDYGGFTPMYSLTIKGQDMEQFVIASYNNDATHVGLMYQGEYYSIGDDEFSKYLKNISAGSYRPDVYGNGGELSLNDLIILSQKKKELSWEDFQHFPYVETGFGLYIRVYEINPIFSLWIGGGNPDDEPMYIKLRTNREPEDDIDIRTDDVEAFIEKHIDDLTVASHIRVYRFNDSQDFVKTAVVVLNEDGTFTFNFSPISSYLGFGTYRVDDYQVILNTDDGNYTYIFNMVDDTLVFDAHASSEQVWFSGITDGSVFK